MEKFLRFCKKLLILPIWLSVVLFVASILALAAVFVNGIDKSIIAYAVYGLSFYSFVVVCVTLIPFLWRNGKNIKQKLSNSRFGEKYIADRNFKTLVGLYRSLAFNILYAGVNLFSGIYYNTAWFKIYAVYYLIMAVMRFLLLKYINKVGIGNDIIGELKRTRMCACILLTVNFALSAAVLMMAYVDKGFEYHGVLIYIMAMYTFGITVAAIVNLVRYRKYNSPVMSMTKIISLASALVSMLSLETAMLTSFGADMTDNIRRIFIIATGAGISVVISCASACTIIITGIKMKKLKTQKRPGN